ncbi:unnamed protein product, partial [Gulo gulo]
HSVRIGVILWEQRQEASGKLPPAALIGMAVPSPNLHLTANQG